MHYTAPRSSDIPAGPLRLLIIDGQYRIFGFKLANMHRRAGGDLLP
jgi:hypothetical protein